MCDLDLLKKSISEDAKVALMNNLGPQNFERPTPNQPLVYTGDNVSVASIADNTVSSWASKRFGPKFSANWIQTQRDNNRILIDIRIPEILDLALNVKYGGTSLQTANNILKGVDEDDLETRLSGYIKPGVQELFDSIPELASIGTPEQYSRYLDTIFPGSQVKDIVYHVNKNGTISIIDNKAFYSTDFGTWLIELEEIKGKRIPILLNITNPTIVDSYYEFTDRAKEFREDGLGDEYVTPDEVRKENTDSVIGRDSGQGVNEKTYVTYKKEQVHQLGTKKDIELFKDFVGRDNVIKPGVEEVFDSNPELANQVYEALGFGINKLTGNLKFPSYNKQKEYYLAKNVNSLLQDIVKFTEDNDTKLLAQSLLQVPNINNIPLAVTKYTKELKGRIEEDINALGTYSSAFPELITIIGNLPKTTFETVFLHELIHGITVNEYYHNKEFADKINKLYNHTLKFKDYRTSTGILLGKMYGMKNPKEFMAEAMSNPDFIYELSKYYSPSQEKLKEKNIFQEFIELIVNSIKEKITSKGKKYIENNLGTAVLNTIANYANVKSSNFKSISKLEANQITPQQALQLYSQYLESLNKPNTNPILQGNQQEQVKKFAELQERLSNKEFLEGAKGVYESTPALQQLGTQEEYNNYIARVSLGILKNPSSGEYNYTSQVKDIVYHDGGQGAIKEEGFKKDFIGISDGGVLGDGFYFYADRNKRYDKWRSHTESVILNIKNLSTKKEIIEKAGLSNKKDLGVYEEALSILSNIPHDSNRKNLFHGKYIGNYSEQLNKINIDGLTGPRGGNIEYVVFEPEQIHILGGNQDIEGFRGFVSTDNTFGNIPIIETEDIVSYEGTKGAAQYDGKNKVIKVNRKLLREKFESKAWTKPRKLMEVLHGENVESYAQALPEDQFTSYAEWEQFVINHEYQHSLYSRSDFDRDFPNKNKGDYETEINRRALNQMLSSRSEAQQLDRVQYLDELVEKQLAEGTKALVEMGAATTKGNETARATEGLSKLVDQINNFAERIGVEYEILSTVEEAANVIGNANTIGGLSANSIIASGAPAFFYNGKVYFIAPRLSMGAVFHEFSHPIIKALSNVEGKKLFNSLYEQAIGTSEGQQILNQMLSEFPEGSQQTDDFKEELIIRALDKIYSANKYKNPVSKDFDSFTKKLFFAIKQFLRKVFGVKIKVEKLSSSTTLEELAAMITGDKFSIDIPKITREDFVAFSMASKAQISEINKINDQSLFDLIDAYQTTLSSIRNDIKTKNLTELKKLLVGDADRKMILSEVLSDLYSAKKNSEEFIRTTTSTTLAETQKTLAANTLARNLESISNIADILLNSIENINPTGLSVEDQKAFAGKIQYAGEIVSYLEELFKITQSAMKEAGIKEDTPEWQTITLFFGKLPALKTAINAKMISILSEVTSSLVTDMREAIKRQAIADFKKAIKNNPTIQQKIENGFEDLTDADLNNITPQVQATILRSYKNFKSDYEAISKEALNDILSGNYKDNSRLNTLLESYTNNQNPVIGSFAAFYKQQQASAEALTVREAEDFMKALRRLIEGMSQEEIANLGKDLAFEDKTFIINKDGDVEEKIVLTYLNRFKNYRFELKRREVAFEKANRNGTYAEKSAAYQELQDFKRKYFWQEYTQEYYTLDKIYQEIDAEDLDALYEEDKDLYEIKPDGVYFEGKALENPNSLSNIALIKEHISNIIGSTAFLDKQVILDSLNSAQRSAKTETELFEKNNEIEALQRMYRQLFSMTYEDGVTLKTGKDLIKTKLHIKYREKSNSFVEYKLIDGAFERSLRNFLDELALRETPGTDEYYKERDEWIRQNSQIEFTEDYYEERRQAIERLKAFTESKLPDSPEARLIAENYKIIYSMLSIFKDTDNAPDAIEMGPKRIANIKRLMEEIQDARDNMAIKNGLTKKEDAELQTLWAQIKSGSPLTVLQQRRFNELSYKQTKGGLSKADKNTYNKLIADVSSLTEKVPTQQYLDALNYWLNTRLSLGLPEITEGNANEYLDYDKIAVYFKRDPDFKNWFEANHILTEYYDYDLDDLVYTYKRVSAWEMARPSDEVYLKETQLNIIDEKTGKPMVLKRVPKARFKKRVVKDEFRLVKQNEDWTMYIGKYFDNRGRYLPRDYVPGDPNSAEDNFLINEKYDELRVNDPKKFAILEYMKQQQLKEESKLEQNYAKLYLDMPRYYLKTGIERRKEARRNIKRTVESVKRALSNINVTDDVSAELLADDTLNMTADLAFVETDVLGNRREIIPIGGMSALETNQVSKDVIRGHLSRIIDIAKFNVLQDTSSVAKAFVSVLNNNDPKDMNSIDRRVYQTTGKLAFTKSKSKSNTAGEAMAYFYEREYLGKKYSEEVNPYVDQLVKGLMKQVSFGYFALDLASAAKNYFSQLIQNGIETAGGEYLDVQSLAMGKAMAYAHTSKNLFQRLDRGTKDLSTQMILAFEPIQDRYKDDFADSYTNSIWNELASLKLFMAPRRFLERESVLELFFGMMSKKLIDQTLSDGKVIKIRYSQAFETDSEGNMVLKKGVDERYAVGGSEFAKFRIVVQEKSNLLYGTYAKMDQPMAQKYFAYRLMSWLRRYFTSMIINRWGFKLKPGGKLYKASSYQYRYNWALNEMTRGYYIESMITLVKTLRTFGTYLPYMSRREAVALRKTLYDALAATLLAMLPKLLFGYDGGDDERFEKLKALSGPLGSDNFKIDGWLTQHAIYQMKAVFGETTTFVPIPGLGEQEIVDVGTVSNVLLGRGIGNYTNLLMDLYYISTGDERAQYRRDMGPFPWQDKGDYKIYNHIGKMFGVKGKFWDPVLAIKAQETIEAMGQAK